ncbi:unnamed protein product [Vitrella brassicaformis CCMP3155]|uniref:Uncharacterized protein n=1 Tax=Vitrella brassicaformis (strain CCMP3155) TaxID=1169540 RepID=A0A0G4H1H3_VITBC|nr:unnamed protein product [Vitrella brassicaformis CCMP3155]|eukprot:CEM37452.1 unnamed protein product [Vitrella brassicaformis CCMP3155]
MFYPMATRGVRGLPTTARTPPPSDEEEGWMKHRIVFPTKNLSEVLPWMIKALLIFGGLLFCVFCNVTFLGFVFDTRTANAIKDSHSMTPTLSRGEKTIGSLFKESRSGPMNAVQPFPMARAYRECRSAPAEENDRESGQELPRSCSGQNIVSNRLTCTSAPADLIETMLTDYPVAEPQFATAEAPLQHHQLIYPPQRTDEGRRGIRIGLKHPAMQQQLTSRAAACILHLLRYADPTATDGDDIDYRHALWRLAKLVGCLVFRCGSQLSVAQLNFYGCVEWGVEAGLLRVVLPMTTSLLSAAPPGTHNTLLIRPLFVLLKDIFGIPQLMARLQCDILRAFADMEVGFDDFKGDGCTLTRLTAPPPVERNNDLRVNTVRMDTTAMNGRRKRVRRSNCERRGRHELQACPQETEG